MVVTGAGEIMRSTYYLGQIFGVRIRLHYTWIFAFALIIAFVVTQFPEAYPLWQRAFLGIVASLIFITAIAMRELILSLTAINKGIPVKGITLFVFGGVSRPREATLPILELLMAAAGLLSNLIIAALLYGIHLIILNTDNVIIAGVTPWPAFLYSILVLFHFTPALPLDGGRALLALIWKITNNYNRAIRITSWTGWGVGLLLAIGGILVLITSQEWFVGLTLAFVGWVLQIAATHSRQHMILHEALQNSTARDIIARECQLITQDISILQLVRDYVLITGQNCFAVVDDGKLRGIVTMRNLKSIPKARWSSTYVSGIMTPASKVKTAHAELSAASLLDQMDELRINEMPVIEQDKVIGIATRGDLMRLVKTRAELRL